MEESILKLAAVARSVLKLELAHAVSPTWRIE